MCRLALLGDKLSHSKRRRRILIDMVNAEHHITHVDQTADGLLLFFKDGRAAFYSDELLHTVLYLAKRVSLTPEDDDF
jgi:hypothetical protein